MTLILPVIMVALVFEHITKHAITTSIMGVGCAKGVNAFKLHVVERILWTWVLAIPAAGLDAYGECLQPARQFGSGDE